jgi:phosphatidylinositol glycan class M
MWLAISIHFKIYPIIYLPTSLIFLSNAGTPLINLPVLKLINTTNIKFMIVCGATVAATTGFMYYIYGYEFLYHAYLYHLERLDHRHNFSVYNVVLYYKSAIDHGHFSIETYAFIPQLLISAGLLPLLFGRSNIVSCLFLQTFAFVTFNKVMTSQYFIWFLIFLPNFLATSNLMGKNKIRGLIDVGLWVVGQALWLNSAYQLEFLGQSTFDGQLLFSAILFYWINCWILSDLITDLNTTTT